MQIQNVLQFFGLTLGNNLSSFKSIVHVFWASRWCTNDHFQHSNLLTFFCRKKGSINFRYNDYLKLLKFVKKT